MKSKNRNWPLLTVGNNNGANGRPDAPPPGGERIAGFLTLASSAHRNNLDVRAYLRVIVQRLLDGETNYESMLPWNWASAHPECIREYRRDERRDRDERKQTKRAQRRGRKRLFENRTKAT